MRFDDSAASSHGSTVTQVGTARVHSATRRRPGDRDATVSSDGMEDFAPLGGTILRRMRRSATRLDDGPIRVLRVIARLNVGGPALHVSYLTKELDERGYESTLAAGFVGEGEGSMEYVARELGIEPVLIPGLQRDVSPLRDAAVVKRLLSLIREVRPHVLHTHTAKAGAVGRAAALLAGTARPNIVVHTFHGHVLRGYFQPGATAVFRQLERRLAGATDALIAVSPEVRDDLVRLGIAPRERIAVIRLGLDLEGRVRAPVGAREALRAQLGIDEESFVIGWLGRMTEIKRVDVLLRAFAQLRSAGVESDLVLVGDGPLRQELKRLARELGVESRCHFVGFSEQVSAHYAAFDAVALTSASEGTPVTLIEALAAACPVVSTDVGGVSDVVEDCHSGYLVAPGDVAALAERLQRLAGDPALRREFGEAGRSFVVPRYSVPRLVDDVDRLYRTLLEQAAPREHRVYGALARPLSPALPALDTWVGGRRPEPAERRLRIVLLSQYFPPEIGATQSRMQAFAEYLAARGHEVTVVCEFPNHPHGVMPAEYRGRVVEDDRSNSYRILRVWVMASPEKTQRTRMQFYLSYMALATAVAPLVGRVDVVLATSPPLFTGLAGTAIARLNGAPLVLDVRDLWPAAAASLGQISLGPAFRIAEALERFLYREAAIVVAVTNPFCRYIDARRGRPPGTVLIPNGTLDVFFAEGDAAARTEPGRNGRFLVTFAGTHGIAQALPSVLDAAERMNGVAEFAFVGDGPVKRLLVEDARRRGLANVTFHDQIPIERAAKLLAQSDALLVPISAHPTFSDFVPSKLLDFMALGRPVVLSARGEAAGILALAQAGIAVEPEDPDALADAVRWLVAHPVEADEMGLRGREFARRRLRSEQAARLEQVLLDVARRS